ncbi:MAG: TIR domain-containing protein [Proteobacteria bacterium]|nr:TIR domain-containing protein [Pseudomonadota bacterium]
MARKVFFSYDYERDRYKVGKVRDSWLTTTDREVAGIWDENNWDSARMKGDDAIHSRIKDELEGTSVTVVLIGHATDSQKYVDYTISESCSRGNAILGIFIDKLKDVFGCVDLKGANPLHQFRISDSETLADIFPTYDWIKDNGEENMNDWIEEAAKIVEG